MVAASKTVSSQQTSSSYGWVVVAASFLVMFGPIGASLSFGVFMRPFADELGFSRATVSGAMSIILGVSGLVGILAGRLADKYGARVLIGASALVSAAGYMLMYTMNSPWELYIYIGVCQGACLGASHPSITANVSRWFNEKRALALGITSLGAAFAQMLMPLIAAYFIAGYGWRFANIPLGILALICAIPALIVLRRSPPQSKPDDAAPIESISQSLAQPKQWSPGEAVRTVPFWMMVATAFMGSIGFHSMLVHIVAYAEDVGIPTTAAAFTLTLVSSGSVAALLSAWIFIRKIGSRATMVIMLTLQALALFLLIGAINLWMFFTLGFILGFGLMGSNTVRIYMASEFFGIKSVGTILGFLAASWGAGGILGPMLAGSVFDSTQSYNIALLISGVLLSVSTGCALYLKAPKPNLRACSES